MASQSKKPKITFFFSDTGGGHRAAMEAIIEALHCEFGEKVETNTVDFYKEYAPPPFNRVPESYPDFVHTPELWGAVFNISDGPAQGRILTSVLWPYVGKAAARMVQENYSDLFVSLHPLANSFVLKALGKSRPPFVTVVTDLVSTHALWFDKHSDLTIVPTELARQHALKCDLLPEKVQVVGLPVGANCIMPPTDKNLLRDQYGWQKDKMIALVVGGAEGMGPLAETAAAIDESDLDVAMVIVAGKNSKLEAELRERQWRKPIHIYGYVREMPGFMRAADVIVTKAGPGTIAEALVAGIPMILYMKVPKQEDGNVEYVLAEKMGVWAPEADEVVRVLKFWSHQPEELKRIRQNCLAAARPQASRDIAMILAEKVGLVEGKT